MPVEFHWIRPWFLVLLPVVWLFCYWLQRYSKQTSGWQSLISGHLQGILLVSPAQKNSFFSRSLLPLLLTLAVLASAGPAFQKQPQPAYSLKKATVLVMDMSLSMRATDLKPNRLTQARFKALDFVKALKEGELALVSFAGDAFVISPLTPDHNNISLLLPDLKPEIMPVQGSDLAAALSLADKLLLQAGYRVGDVVVFTDGFSSRDYQGLRNLIDGYSHRVSILTFGTSDGAPVQLEGGELLKDNRGAIVIPKVPLAQLKQLAELSHGVFVQQSIDNSDIQKLVELSPLKLADNATESDKLSGDQWQDAGIYLVWLMLPILLFAQKKSLLPLAIAGLLLPATSKAADWQDLYLSPQQQAKNAYEQGDFNKAQQKFADPLWQGNAAYRDGRFADAEALYRKNQNAEGLYNLGNSLAKQQKFAEAISAYENALKADPALSGAKENLAAVKQMSQQQQQQKSANQSGEDQTGEQQSNQQSGEQQSSDKQSGDNQSESQQSGKQQSEDNNQQNPEQQNGQQQQSEAGESQNQEDAAKQQSQQQKKDQAGKAAGEQPSPTDLTAQQGKAEQQRAVNEAWPQATPEQSQQLESLMRKVQDDPSILLRNKMYIEYQKRQHQGLPQGVTEEW